MAKASIDINDNQTVWLIYDFTGLPGKEETLITNVNFIDVPHRLSKEIRIVWIVFNLRWVPLRNGSTAKHSLYILLIWDFQKLVFLFSFQNWWRYQNLVPVNSLAPWQTSERQTPERLTPEKTNSWKTNSWRDKLLTRQTPDETNSWK